MASVPRTPKSNPPLLKASAQKAERSGRLARAIELLEEALRQSPGDWPAVQRLANLKARVGERRATGALLSFGLAACGGGSGSPTGSSAPSMPAVNGRYEVVFTDKLTRVYDGAQVVFQCRGFVELGGAERFSGSFAITHGDGCTPASGTVVNGVQRAGGAVTFKTDMGTRRTSLSSSWRPSAALSRARVRDSPGRSRMVASRPRPRERSSASRTARSASSRASKAVARKGGPT